LDTFGQVAVVQADMQVTVVMVGEQCQALRQLNQVAVEVEGADHFHQVKLVLVEE
jgi:alpha/beta superfamily hydrolase